MIVLRNVSHAVAVSSIAANQQFIFGSDGCAQHSFHAVGAAALQKNRGIVFRLLSGEGYEFFAQFLHNAEIVVFIPCTPVGHHSFFNGG